MRRGLRLIMLIRELFVLCSLVSKENRSESDAGSVYSDGCWNICCIHDADRRDLVGQQKVCTTKLDFCFLLLYLLLLIIFSFSRRRLRYFSFFSHAMVNLNASTIALIKIGGNCPCLLCMLTNTTLNRLGFRNSSF